MRKEDENIGGRRTHLLLHDGQAMMTIPFSYARLVKVCVLRCPHFCTGSDSDDASASEELDWTSGVAMGAVHVNVRDNRGSFTASVSAGDEEAEEVDDEAGDVEGAKRVEAAPERFLRKRLWSAIWHLIASFAG